MKHLLKIISSLTILSTGILAISCTNKQTNPNKNINEENNSSRHRRSISDTSEIKLETIVSEDIKNKGIAALQKVFKEQEEAFGSFHTYQDVVDQLKVYLKDMGIYHLDYLFLTNQNEKNNSLKVDNNGILNDIKISYFDKQLNFTPKIVLENKVKDKYNDNGNELIQVGYELQDLINNIKLTKIRKNTIKVPIHLPLKINSLDESFKGLESSKIDNLEKWNTKNIKFLTKTFEEAKNFNQSINSWDVSNVIDMTEMFAGASKFNQDLNSWDTSKVQSMRGVFWDAESFNGDISNWNVKTVDDMQSMFSGTKNFNIDLDKWNTSNVESMEGMFSRTDAFNGKISNWNTSKVISMKQMFQESKSFKQDLSSWDISKVTHAEMFRKGSEKNIIDDYLPKFPESIRKTL
ncbi:BspA family leucine-rich repeat surface protein [Mycoplasma capricolum subsp. capricolum]|uniref:BspA family leucine-rich repeat surface protein n=1 Tax=Mycoplasma capricolum TaxID=2095 RepID=UPI003DA6027E